jgi:acyl carrier protein
MAVETISKPGTAAATFPKATVEAKLREVLLDAAQSDATLKGVTLPPHTTGKCGAVVQLDSLNVVSLLCELEEIVKFELKDSLVRAGGYTSVNQAMDHLMPRIEKAWEKNGSTGAKK